MTDDLLKLADRCEQATGPDRELDAEIGRFGSAADFLGYVPDEPQHGCMSYTASIDAALTLVPEGWHVGMLTECDEDDYPAACLTENQEPCRDALGKGADMALSLCAAALRARAQATTDNPPQPRKD